MKSSAVSDIWNPLTFAIWLVCALAMAPVLIHPQWGMFSDPNQIVDACTTIYSNGFNWKLWEQNMWVDFRPGFHLLDLLVWAVSPDQPFGFYLFRYICFALTVTFTYLNCYQLTRARAVSFATSLIWFLTYPTYEVIYTLDKGEIYLGLLFALFVNGYLNSARLVQECSESKRQFIVPIALMAFSAAYAIFTKQTGLLVLGYSIVLVLASISNKLTFSKRDTAQSAITNVVKSSWMKETIFPVTALILTLVSWLIFRIFYVLHGGLQFKYGEVVTTPSFLMSQFVVYMQVLPEFFVLLTFAAIATLIALLKQQSKQQANLAAIQSLCLVLAVAGGSLAMCAWKSQVGYIWYPLFSMLLPAVSFSLFAALGSSLKRVFLLFAFAAAILLPERIYDAQTQYAMDATFNRFIEQLVHLPKKLGHETNAIVKLREQNSAELGEEIEYALRDVERRKRREQVDLPFSINIYNIIRNSSGDLAIDRATLTEEVAYPQTYKRGAGLDKFMYLPNQLPHWTIAKVQVGDVLLIPFGNVQVKTAPYRGTLCFAKPSNAFRESLPQCELRLVLSLSKSFKRWNGAKTEIGWTAYQVGAAPAVALPLGDYGWFRNAQSIYFDPEFKGKSLNFEFEEALVSNIYATSGGTPLKISKLKLSNGNEGFTIQLRQNPVQCSGGAAFHQPVLFKAKSVAID